MTRAQLLQHFNDDAEIVDAVILRKETDPELRGKEIREHPECPGLKQYLVLADDSEYDESAVEISDLFQAEDYASDSDDDSSSSSSSSKDSGVQSRKKKPAKKDKKDNKDKKSKKNKKEKKDKKVRRKGKGKDKKGEDTEEKKQSRKLTMEANKVLSTASRKIKALTLKKSTDDISALSPELRKALVKDMDATIAKLSTARAQLQQAVDFAKDSDIKEKMDVAQQCNDEAETAFSLKRPKAGTAKAGKK